MLLRHVSLKNIRSFNDDSQVDIDLSDGTLLFEGDVGSGKSTILYAIEFALFGLGEMSGDYLLSEGKQSGHVKVSLVQSGKNLDVYRGIRRKGESVVQEGCYISEDGSKTELSAGDLKQRVITLLGFNERSHPRAESLVYRYAIFTPQEQMKEIIQRHSDERLLVIRRVLGIQSYQVAAENTDLVQRRLRADAKAMEMSVEDLGSKEEEASLEQARIEELNSRIPGLQAAEVAARDELDSLNSRWEKTRDERERVGAIAGLIPELRRGIERSRSDKTNDELEISALSRRLEQDYLPTIRAFRGKRPPSKRKAVALEATLKLRRKSLEKKRQTLLLLEQRLKETRELGRRKVCPRCGQRIPKGFENRFPHLEREREEVSSEVSKLGAEVSELEKLHRRSRTYEEEGRAFLRDSKQKVEIERQIADRRRHASESQKELGRLESELAKSEAEEARLQELTDKIGTISRALKDAQSKAESTTRVLTEAVTKRDEGREFLTKLRFEIEEKREKLKGAMRLKSYAVWLAEFFRPTVELIEKQTMVQTNARFSRHFQRFFSSLVDDPDLRVRAKEDFSPVFERQGYSQEYDSLSGGERTSVALAYRLSLNVIVQEDVGTGIGDLVILDEPTDGFSKEQIQKMRYMLEELRSRQVIVVSHEKELESMADRILIVHKVNGTSRVSPP